LKHSASGPPRGCGPDHEAHIPASPILKKRPSIPPELFQLPCAKRSSG
jgi:hypothetical protein